jgi:para-nitrobenzyl esterase
MTPKMKILKKLSVLIISLLLSVILLLLFSFRYSIKPRIYIDPVMTEAGLVSGVKSETSNVIAYKGIPFAAPPVGELRWKAPQPAIAWQGVRKCESFGPSPMQAKPVPFMVYTPEFLIPEKPISEDCLYLNVWSCASKGDKKPVLVWIYGGGFSSGGTAVPIYDGEALAKKGIIFVSVNYRVGVFGFLAHPDLTKEAPYHSSGNYGLLDQVAALEWIKKNISAFGGDPDNVTIDGQSAGSMSVNCLVASPVAKGLFNKGIAESGSFFIMKTNNLKEAEKQGLDLASYVHAVSLEDLRKIPAEQLLKFPAQYRPIIDGYILPKSVPEIFAEEKENNVPLIIGWNADESFVNGFKNKEVFQKEAREKYGKDADEFLKYFPANTDEEATRSQIIFSRDMIFAVSGYKWAGIQSLLGKSPVFVYYFARKLPAIGDFVKYGAFHTGEVAYVMDNLRFLNRPWEPVDFQLADMMSNYWINFISNSNPNNKDLPNWPAYNTKTYQAMVFDKNSGKQALPDKEGLEFLSTRPDK